ncbi:MAG: hypothetical protein FWG64_04685 [Firmicutes bacterium]|nr:hypothetical protein [Bacillota bacterium]
MNTETNKTISGEGLQESPARPLGGIGQELLQSEQPGQQEETSEPPTLEALFDMYPHLKAEHETAISQERTNTASQIKAAERKRAEIERQRIEKITASNLTREQKLEALPDAERAEYYKKLLEEREQRDSRREEVNEFTAEIHNKLDNYKIPREVFETGIDYYAIEDLDSVHDRVLEFAKYEYFERGKFEELVAAEVEKRLKAKFRETAPVQANNSAPLKGGRPLEIYEG